MAGATRAGKSLPACSAALGLAAGLLEGGGHMMLHRFDMLDNSWYPIIWIAAVFNGLLVGTAGLAAAAVLRRWPGRRWLKVLVVFSLVMLAVVPVLALTLKQWIYRYAIALLILGTAAGLTRWYLQRESWARSHGARAMRWTLAATVIAFAVIEGGGVVRERWATDRLAQASTSAPDVLLIIVDTLRSDHLASYGYSRQTSPAIDGLAAEGVVFENSFSTSSYTLPSHASILMGRYPYDHNVEWDTPYRRPARVLPTLAEELRSRGYRTGAFSANTFYFTREHGFGRGFLHFEDFYHSLSDMAWRTAWGGIVRRFVRPRLGLRDLPGRKLAADVTSAAGRWIGQNNNAPFFVTLNYMDTHDPYLPPEPYRSRFSPALGPGGLIHSKMDNPASLTPAELQSEIDAYDGAITYVDDQVSQLLSDVRAMPRSRPLMVIVTSDHGEEFGEHGGFLHQRHLYREVIQVPLIIWGPGSVPGGTRVSQPVSNAAIPATLLSVLGGESAVFPVPSLKPLWEGATRDHPMPLSELKHMPWAEPATAPIRFGSMRSLVDGSFHYIEQDGRSPQLFSWPGDTKEASDLGADPSLRAVIARFKERLGQMRQ